MVLPIGVDGIAAATFFKGTSGASSAAQWRTFARHYAALVLIDPWTWNDAIKTTYPEEFNQALTESELRMLLLVVQIADTALRPMISCQQIKLLRLCVSSLQDTIYKERPTIVLRCNIHWLAHLADDIERYGPVYSWWLFGYERSNKLLKGANNNGHSQDTPMIAYNKFLRFGSLGQWGSCSSTNSDIPGQHLAEQSETAFGHAMKTVNITEEQEDAPSWQTEKAEESETAQHLDGTHITVQKKAVAPISKNVQEEIILAWNADPSVVDKVRINGSDKPSIRFVLSEHALFITAFRIGRNCFRTPGPAKTVPDLRGEPLVRLRGSFFEWRTDGEVFECRQRRAPVGFIECVFEVSASAPGGFREGKRFINAHMLSPFEEKDPYAFGERMSAPWVSISFPFRFSQYISFHRPHANIWLWHPQVSKTQVLPFSKERIDCMRPVIIKPLYMRPGDRNSEQILAIKAITHS